MAMQTHFKRYFLAGLILWAPLSITIWVITWVFDLLDSVLPVALRSEVLFGVRIPLVRSIYSSVKQVSDTILAPNGQAFRQAVLVQYPRHGAWTIAFLTGSPAPDVATLLPTECVSVYVPTTPNPTSGFFLMMPKTEVIELSIGVDAALKYVVSMGTVPPQATKQKPPNN